MTDRSGSGPACQLLGLRAGKRAVKSIYLIVIAAKVIGTLMSTVEVDLIKALVWSAIANGVISVLIMVVMMMIGQQAEHDFRPSLEALASSGLLWQISLDRRELMTLNL